MKPTLKTVICTVAALLVPMFASAQVDHFGTVDTIYADVAKLDDHNWTITVSYTNDESVVGLSVPLKMTAGLNRVIADSAVYTGGRVEKFSYKGFRADTAIQCVLLGMIANLGPTQIVLPSGSGRLVTVFVSSVENKPINKLVVDTATLHPNNSLLVIADRSQLDPEADTVPVHMSKKLEIIPAFVARQEEVAVTESR